MPENISNHAPPPPPLPSPTQLKDIPVTHYEMNMSQEELCNVCFKEVLSKCSILNISCAKDKIWMHPVPTLLQNGPTCGLVALCMFAQSIGKRMTVDDLLQSSQEKGYTYHGEMFSTENLKKLCDYVLGSDLVTIKHQMQNLEQDKANIIDELKSGAVILIAYDDDFNFDPCLKNGAKAHWALIFGVIEADDGDPYLLAKQGKSSHVGVWRLSCLSASNANLHDAGSERTNGQYLIPAEGIGYTLRNQYLLLKRKQKL